MLIVREAVIAPGHWCALSARHDRVIMYRNAYNSCRCQIGLYNQGFRYSVQAERNRAWPVEIYYTVCVPHVSLLIVRLYVGWYEENC